MPRLSNISPEDQKKLAAALMELKSRGIELPQLSNREKAWDWPVDKNGYFVKQDGRQFNLHYTNSKGEDCIAEGKQNFISTKARFSSLFGGRGSGKSGAGSQKACRKIMAGESGAVINPDFENFRFSTWPEFREWIPWEMVVKSQRQRQSPVWQPRMPFVMVFQNGVKVYCKGLKDPDSARGPNLNWLWYDEGSRDDTGMSWNIAIASVRVGRDPQAWVTCTPNGEEHWTYQFFVKQEIAPEILDLIPKDTKFIEWFSTTIEENKENLDPAFYASMLAAYPSGWLRDQELYGRFVSHGGKLGDPAWFTGKVLPEPIDPVKKRIRYWDLAASERGNAVSPEPARTCGTKFSWDGEKKYFIEHIIQGLWKWDTIKASIIETAMSDGPEIEIWIEQEPGSGGKNQIAEIASMSELEGFKVQGDRPDEDKVIRANTWFADAALGNVYMVRGPWNDAMLAQLASFPSKRQKDIIDSISGARKIVNPAHKWRRIGFMSLGGNRVKQNVGIQPEQSGLSRGIAKL
jgi:predicted phage terminase large subunit-like protein